MTNTVLGYWIDAAGQGSLRAVPLRAAGPDDVELRAVFSGVSPGTERLVGNGRVPATADATMAVPGMLGSFALPILYGYAFVGAIARGARAGQRAFTMFPHQQRAVVAAADCVWLPDDVPSPRATLFANLETAWNAVHDAELVGEERVVVVGGGAVGLLTCFVLAQEHLGEVVLVERDDARRAFAGRLPWVRTVAAPADVAPGSQEVALHATGNAAGLQAAIDAVGFEGRVVDLSWYGEEPVTLRLGDSFHRQRKRILASQVGTVAPSVRAAGRAGRTAAVRTLLRDASLDALLTTPVPFASLPQFFAGLYRGAATAPCPVVAYG